MVAQYTSPGSHQTYTAPSGAIYADIVVRGGVGGDGGDSTDFGGNNSGASGGAAGVVTARISLNGGETFDIYVGENGTDGTPAGSGGAGGSTSRFSAGDGGGDSSEGGAGGGGGAASELIRQSDSAVLAVGAGGGGGAGGYDGYGNDEGGAGGGGAPGGAGGYSQFEGDGGDADGTGSGGDGGEASYDAGINPGDPGGTSVHGDLTNVSTGTSTSGPLVEINTTTLDPPTAPQNLTASSNSDSQADLTWDEPTDWGGDQGGYNIYRGTSSGSHSQIDSVGSGTTTYTDSGLTNGEQYYYVITAYNSAGESDPSNEDSATTNLPGATSLSAEFEP